MKFIYLTAKKYPSNTADHAYIKELAKSFTKILGNSFLLVVNKSRAESLEGIKHLNVSINPTLKRTLFYFFWLPYFFITKCKSKSKNVDKSEKTQMTQKTVFFSNDLNLLSILIFWRKIFRFDYTICSDWHLLVSNWRDTYVSKNSDFLITTSHKLEKQLFSISKNPHILTVYGGVDLSVYKKQNTLMDKNQMRRDLHLPFEQHSEENSIKKSGKKLIGYVGLWKTLGMDKGISTMIKSLEFLNENFMMVFVGGNEEEIKEYSSLAQDLKVGERCIFIERKSFEEVALYEKALDALVIPYPDKPHFRLYGFPMKVYEYMASGTPIIYSKLELAEEVLFDCAFGFIPDNPSDLARSIQEALSLDKEAQNRLKEAVFKAYNKVKGLTWDKKAEKILEFTCGSSAPESLDFKALKH